MEILKQPQYSPLPVEKQIVILYVATNGYLDDYPVEALGNFEEQFYVFMESQHPDILKSIRENGDIDSDTEMALKDAIEDFKKVFVAQE